MTLTNGDSTQPELDIVFSWQQLGIGRYNVPIDRRMIRDNGTVYHIPCHLEGDSKRKRQIRAIKFDRDYVCAKIYLAFKPLIGKVDKEEILRLVKESLNNYDF